MPKYKVLVGLDYPPNRRAEAGSVVDDLPSKSVKWLREQGLIEVLDGSGKAVEEPAEEPAETPVEAAEPVKNAKGGF